MAFDPDKFIQDTGIGQKPSTSFDPDKFIADITPKPTFATKVANKGVDLAGKAATGIGNAGQGFFAGVNEGIPFSNVLDKAGAGVAAGLQSATDIFRSPPDKKSLEQHYNEALSFIKNERAQDIAKSPVAAGAGELTGAATGIAIPIPGSSLEGLAGIGARVAGQTGLAALERGTAGPQAFDPEAAAQAARVGGALSAGIEAVPVAGKFAAPITDKLASGAQAVGESLSDFGAGRAVKAAFGNASVPWRKIGGPDADRVTQVGEQLLSGEQGIEPVVKFGSNASSISERATDALKKTWTKIDQIHAAADTQGIGIDGADIASKILEKASKIKDVPQNQPLINSLQEQALFYEHQPSIPLSQAQELKNQYSWTMPTGNSAKDILGKDGNNAVKSAIGDSMKETVAESNIPGKENYPDLLNKYGAYATAAGPAAETALREAKNRTLSLTDYLAGNAGATLFGTEGKGHGLEVGLMALGNKIARERGNSALASSAYNLGQALQNAPEAMAKYGDILQNALQNGAPGFAAAHAILMNDPKYRALRDSKPSSSFDRMIEQKYGGRK